MSPSLTVPTSGTMAGMANTSPARADIQVGTMGGIPVVRYGPDSHFSSGKSMSRQTLLAFRTLTEGVVHPEAIVED